MIRSAKHGRSLAATTPSVLLATVLAFGSLSVCASQPDSNPFVAQPGWGKLP